MRFEVRQHTSIQAMEDYLNNLLSQSDIDDVAIEKVLVNGPVYTTIIQAYKYEKENVEVEIPDEETDTL